MPLPRFLLALVLAFAACSSMLAGDWPQWRGPNHDGISQEKDLPVKWSPTENIAWRLPLPGPGGSTPVVRGKQIFLTSAKDDQIVLLCVSTDGKLQWQQTLSSGNADVRGDEGNYASPSACVDARAVYALSGTGALAAFAHDGKPIWNVDLQQRYGRFNIQFGYTSTPVLVDGKLYLQIMHSDAAVVVCLSAADGQELWQRQRKSDARAECLHSYASPVWYDDGKLQLLITHGADYVIAHDPQTGDEVWRCGGLNPPGNYNETLRLVASPAVGPGIVVVPSAKNGPVLALDPHARGNLTDKPPLWRVEHATPDVPSPVVHDGLVYLCRENGTLICLEASSGAKVYSERAHEDRHRASPVYADGKLYLLARDGTVTVVAAGRKFEILSSNAMAEPLSASLAVADGRLYLRTFSALYAVGK